MSDNDEDESLWTGIEVVQVRAAELAKLHRALHSQRKAITNLREQMEDFVGLDKNTRCQVAELTKEISAVRDLAMRNWAERQERDMVIAARDAEIVRLKAALYDKNHIS